MKKGRGRGRIVKPFKGTDATDDSTDNYPSLGSAQAQTADFPSLGGAPDFPSLGSHSLPPQASQIPSLASKIASPVASPAAKPVPPKEQFADVEKSVQPVKEIPTVIESPPVTSKPIESQMAKMSLTQTSPEKSDKVRVLNGEFPAKRGRGTLGRVIRLRTNHFKLQVTKPLTIYQYDVDVTMLNEKKNNRKMEDNKRECSKDKELMRDFFKTFCEKNLPVQYRNKVVFNFSKNMFSLIKFPFDDKMEVTMHFDRNDYLVNIKPINTVQINLQNLDDPLSIHILDLIMTNNFNYSSHIVNRSFFMPNCNVQQLNFGLELWRGAYASVRPSECGLTWNVDSANTAFLTCVDLLELAAYHYQCDYVNLKGAIEKDRDAKEIGASFLKLYRGRKIKTLTGFRKRITAFGPDTNYKFPLKVENKPDVQISIKDYLKKQYNITLKYPQLPCINLGKTNFLPMELCKTELTQKKNLSEKETADIIKSTAIKASDRLNYIDKWVKSSTIVNDPILKEYNVNLQLKMVELDGRVLNAPDIQYNQRQQKSVVKTDEIGTKGAWDHRNLQFVNPKPLKKWVMLNLSRSNKLDKLEYELINVGKIHGMQVAKAYDVIQKGNRVTDREVNNIMADIVKKHHNPRDQSKLELIVVVLQGSTSTYKCIKTAGDITYGIPTQIIDEKTVFKMNAMTASNILLKINSKINGRNFLLHNNPQTNNLLKLYLQDFFRETMIFGADVTHPAPTQGDISTESIAAVTASLDRDCCYYAARLFAQRSPNGQAYEMIHDLDKMFNDLILEYHKIHNAFPKRIFFYRDGVSEGQFSLVLRHEMNKIRNACQNISSGYKPAITFIIVQKRHHTRFLPTDPNMQNGRANNVPPGTVVDNTVVTENMFDYFLCSHAGIQGTSRPCRYYVLHDDNRLTTDQAQLLSHYLCHIYSRCSRSVSFPAPAYYSHLAAFRGRNYYRGVNNMLDRSKVTSYEIKLHPDIKNLMFYI